MLTLPLGLFFLIFDLSCSIPAGFEVIDVSNGCGNLNQSVFYCNILSSIDQYRSYEWSLSMNIIDPTVTQFQTVVLMNVNIDYVSVEGANPLLVDIRID